MRVRIVILVCVILACAFTGAPASNAPANQYGAHLLVDNLGQRGRANLSWARALVGKGGYVKTLFGWITKDKSGAEPGWKDFVAECYRLDLIPLIRLAGPMKDGVWVKPEAGEKGDYAEIAAAVKRVVADLPKSEKYPLYVEVWNEPNLDLEWSGKADVRQYAKFFVAVSKAIRSIGDSRIKILNGAFALSADSTEVACQAEPEFVNAFDVWASHPYPQNHPPEYNIHDGAVKHKDHTIDAYLLETEVLEKHGRKNIKVMITETGYALGNDLFSAEGYPTINEYNRADYMMRAFRDFYPKWPEVLAVFPFEFSDPGWMAFNWVHPDSGTTEDGLPTRPHYQYECVRKLAKPTDDIGAVSGKVTERGFGVPLEEVVVSLGGKAKAKTDVMGNYFFPKLAPGEYAISAEHPGFSEAKQKVLVVRGKNAVADFKLAATKTGDIWGHVEDGMTGGPVAGADVVLTPGGKKTTTDAGGWFQFTGLPAIAFHLSASKKGFTTHELTGLKVVPGDMVEAAMRIAQDSAPAVRNTAGNPSFELVSDPTADAGFALRWEPLAPGRFSVSAQVSRTGRRSQQLLAEAGGSSALRQITHYNTMEPGKTYACAVWAKAQDIVAEDGGGAWMSMAFTGNGGEFLREVPCATRLTGSTGWTYLEARGVAPPDSKRLSLNLWISAKSGSAYFDDAFIGKLE